MEVPVYDFTTHRRSPETRRVPPADVVRRGPDPPPGWGRAGLLVVLCSCCAGAAAIPPVTARVSWAGDPGCCMGQIHAHNVQLHCPGVLSSASSWPRPC